MGGKIRSLNEGVRSPAVLSQYPAGFGIGIRKVRKMPLRLSEEFEVFVDSESGCWKNSESNNCKCVKVS